MKMARASQADIEAALEVNRILGDLEKGYMPASDDNDDTTWFDRDDPEQCQKVLGQILDAADKGSLFRVTCGMAVILDPRNELLDPDADALEKHPKIVALEADAERYRWLRSDDIEVQPGQREICVYMERLPHTDEPDVLLTGSELDAAIDVARATKEPS